MRSFSPKSFLRRAFSLSGFLVWSIPLVFFFNEFAVHYLAILRCGWNNQDQTKIMILADTHLLGVRNGHWFDKLRREHQMTRAFQSAVFLLRPDAVFFLGDLFDEGHVQRSLSALNRIVSRQWGDDEQFGRYVERFESLFALPDDVQRFTVVGNHDIGFHYAISAGHVERFNRHFGHNPGVERVELNGNHFVLLNSMAMEGDYCRLCAGAVAEVDRIAAAFNCSLTGGYSCETRLKTPYSRPILMQHFPLYRTSDLECMETEDLAPPVVREQKFRERWDCLSRDSTRLLIEKLRPRAAFSGHVHFGCQRWWSEGGFWEWTVASFSWRNNRRPSFLLVTVSPQELHVDRCFLPDEHFVISVYAIAGLLWTSAFFLWCLRSRFISGRRWFQRLGGGTRKPDRHVY